MKSFLKTTSPLALAIGLAFGSTAALAQQQPGSNDPQAGPAPIGQQQRPGQSQNQRPGESQVPDRSQANQDPSRLESESPADNQPRASARDADTYADIDQIAERNSDLSQFVEAVKTAGLVDVLTGGTEYTVFAPTNSALDGANIDSLMEPANRSELIALLRAHIVADDVDQQLASEIDQAQTIDGGTIDISIDEGKLMVGGSEASETQGVELGNLRVYAVNEVLGMGVSARDGQVSLRDGASQRPEADRNSPQ